MSSNKNPKIRIGADTTEFDRKTKGMMARFKSTAMSAAKAIGGSFIGQLAIFEALKRAISGVINLFKEAISVSAKQVAVENNLAAAIASTGGRVSDLLPKYKALASAIQKKTKFGDEDLLQSIEILHRYGVQEKQMKKVMWATVDLAEKTGNLRGATDLLARAAVGETSMLSRYGVKIDENIPKSEKFAAALEQIADKLGGKAVAAAQTYEGRVQQLKNAWGDFLEVIGFSVTKNAVLLQVIRDLTVALSGMSGQMNGTEGAVKGMAVKVAELAEWIVRLVNFGRNFGLAFKAMWEGVKAVVAASIGGIVLAWGKMIDFLASGVAQVNSLVARGLEAVGQKGLAAAIRLNTDQMTAWTGTVTEWGRNLMATADEGMTAFQDVAGTMAANNMETAAYIAKLEALKGKLVEVEQEEKKRLDQKKPSDTGGEGAAGPLSQVQQTIQAILDGKQEIESLDMSQVEKVWAGLGEAIKSGAVSTQQALPVYRALSDVIAENVAWYDQATQSYIESIPVLGELVNGTLKPQALTLDQIQTAMAAINQLQEMGIEITPDLVEALNEQNQALQGQESIISNMASGLESFQQGLGAQAPAQAAWVSGIQQMAASAQQYQEALQKGDEAGMKAARNQMVGQLGAMVGQLLGEKEAAIVQAAVNVARAAASYPNVPAMVAYGAAAAAWLVAAMKAGKGAQKTQGLQRRRHQGGIVESTGEVAILQRGEAVIPRHQVAAALSQPKAPSTTAINVNVPDGAIVTEGAVPVLIEAIREEFARGHAQAFAGGEE